MRVLVARLAVARLAVARLNPCPWTRRQHRPGPLCGAVPMGPFYRALLSKMMGPMQVLLTLTFFFFPAVLRP